MKKFLVVVMGIILSCTLMACSSGGTTEDVKIDYGESEIFTQEEREAAVECILQEFEKGYTDCTLTELSYAGDDENQLGENKIVFHSQFKTGPQSIEEGFNENSTYDDWSWILIRDSKTDSWQYYDGGLG